MLRKLKKVLDFMATLTYNVQADKLIACFLEYAWRCRVVGRARTIGNRVTVRSGSRVRIPPSPPKGLHKIDAPTETPDFIGGFAVFKAEKHKGRMTDENRLFCLNREI